MSSLLRNESPSRVPGSLLKRRLQNFALQISICSKHGWGREIVKSMRFKCPQVDLTRKRTGQVCVITGAARGLGFEILRILLQLEYKVIVGVRDPEGMRKSLEEIGKEGILGGEVVVLELDLKSFSAVRKFGEEVVQRTDRIDMLINNAGIFQQNYELTKDNIEAHFQVNYLSHFLLTSILLPVIKRTAAQRKAGRDGGQDSNCYVINTSSRLLIAAKLKLDDLVARKTYVPVRSYCDTKLCQVMHAKSVHENLAKEGVSNVKMYAVHPGEIPTNIWREYGKIEALFRPILKRICRTKVQAANVILHPAFEDELSWRSGGEYFDGVDFVKAHPQAEDAQFRAKLWEMSMKLTALK